jgi:imidazole glycerol-phosphate synthase subunit HisH
MKTVIIDYGSGNLHSAQKSFERAARDQKIKGEIAVTSRVDDVARADRIVLPGVGAFRDCRNGLFSIDGMRECLQEQMIQRGKPFLGICVGMQLMASRGLEHEVTQGLGWIAGDVVQIEPTDASLKIPHMGWNTLSVHGSHDLLNGIRTGEDGLHAYFVHSYHLKPALTDDILATTEYGGPVTAIVGYENLVGTQFHPEKSQELGLQLIANFLRWKP